MGDLNLGKEEAVDGEQRYSTNKKLIKVFKQKDVREYLEDCITREIAEIRESSRKEIKLPSLNRLEGTIDQMWFVFNFMDLEDMRELRDIVTREIEVYLGVKP